MFAGHLYELLIVLIVFIMPVLVIGGALLLARVAARTAAREYARARVEEERRQRDQQP